MHRLDLIAALGYTAVVQDTRGTGDSGGEPQPFLIDRADGLAPLVWLLAQPWTDGRVLMGGGSVLGIPAYLMASGADLVMQCQLIAIATPDMYSQAAF